MIVSLGVILILPLAAHSQSRYWEKWNAYSANYEYGPSTTYVDVKSKVVVSDSPRIYSFEARIKEEGMSPLQEYKLLVNCTNGSTMYLGHDSTNKWIKADGRPKFGKIMTDICG